MRYLQGSSPIRWLLAGALLFVASAAEATSFEATASGVGLVTGSDGATAEFASLDGCRAATAVAAPGGAGAFTNTICGGVSGSFTQPVWAGSKVTYSDFLLTSSDPGVTGAIVTVAFDIDAALNLWHGTDPNFLGAGATGTFHAIARVNGLISDWRIELGAYEVIHPGDSPGSTVITSNFANNCPGCYKGGGVVSGTLFVPAVFVPVNTPFSVDVQAYADSAITIAATSEVYALNTVSLTSGGPIFSGLPAGVTVSSVSANVVNNLLVPEPALFALLGTAGLLIGGRRR